MRIDTGFSFKLLTLLVYIGWWIKRKGKMKRRIFIDDLPHWNQFVREMIEKRKEEKVDYIKTEYLQERPDNIEEGKPLRST